MSQRWTAIAELATGARMVPKDEADAYAVEAERLREALQGIVDAASEEGFGAIGRSLELTELAQPLLDQARAALDASDDPSSTPTK